MRLTRHLTLLTTLVFIGVFVAGLTVARADSGEGDDPTPVGCEISGDNQQGDDDVCGDLGDDELNGGSGDDQLEGGPGDDVENGQGGEDLVAGNSGSDTLTGGHGPDELSGGNG